MALMQTPPARPLLAAVALLSLPVLAASPTAPAKATPPPAKGTDPAFIPPAFRAERHTGAGEAYLRALPAGTKVIVDRADGAHFELLLKDGKLAIELPASTLSADGGTLTTPLGYKLSFLRDDRRGLVITAPNGHLTEFRPQKTALFAAESDGGVWQWDLEGRGLRLPDGSRIDPLDKGKRWEVLTLRGERYSGELMARRWSALPPIPSPPLVPDTLAAYLSGDGDDWRLPVWEDDAVFAWNWVQVGLPLERAIIDLQQGQRRKDVEYYFSGIEVVQPPAEVGGALLGRRLVLAGGDRVTFALPGEEPVTVFVLPGALEADYAVPKAKIQTKLTPRITGE
jgi:hypothetical protein